MTEILNYNCWKCKSEIPQNDKYCRFCGRGQGKYAAWYYHHWGIILLTLFALGPFALYFVIRSPILGKRAKWIYSVLIVSFTIYIAKLVYDIYLLFAGFFTWI